MGEAAKIKAIAESEGEREARVGIGKAIAIEEQVKAYGGSRYQLVQDIMSKFTAALEKSKIDLVPKTVISMGSNENGGSIVNAFEILLGLIVNDKLNIQLDSNEGKKENEEIKTIKNSILGSINARKVRFKSLALRNRIRKQVRVLKNSKKAHTAFLLV